MFTVDNMLHSYVKRSPLLWFHMKISPFEMINYFINVYSVNRKLHARLEIQNFSSRVEKISRVREVNSMSILYARCLCI